MRKDTFWCRGYKGHQIRGHMEDRVEVIAWFNMDSYREKRVVSYRAAQLAITKYLNDKG